MAQFHSFLCVLSHSVVSNPATPWTVACQAPLSMGFSRQEYWSGCHALLQGIFPTQGSNLGLPNLRQILFFSLLSEPPGEPKNTGVGSLSPLQGNFPSQGLIPGLMPCRQILSFLWLSNIPLYICPTSSLYSPLLMGI